MTSYGTHPSRRWIENPGDPVSFWFVFNGPHGELSIIGMQMPTDSDLVSIVDRTALIENILSQVIEAFCEPRKERSMFFWSVLLDSSVIPMGAKAKVAMAISQEMTFKLDQNAIHTVMSLRNAFAHQPTDSHPVLVVGKTPAEDEMHLQLQILSSSGKISMNKRQEALAEFNSAYAVAKASLVALLEAVKERQANLPDRQS